MYIKRELGKGLTTFKSLRFGSKHIQKNSLRYEVTVGIGGNVGDVRRRFDRLVVFFKRDKRVRLVKTSLILKNPPFGYTKQDDFFNSIIILKTDMQPCSFLSYLLSVEKKFARKRSFANAPRTLDLDIIFFDNRKIDTPRLKIPHQSWFKRDSVTIPLMDIQR